jgi:hypothetical protein
MHPTAPAQTLQTDLLRIQTIILKKLCIADFICRDKDLVKSGGVHVIITFFPTDESEEIQIKGRTCRQDDPG